LELVVVHGRGVGNVRHYAGYPGRYGFLQPALEIPGKPGRLNFVVSRDKATVQLDTPRSGGSQHRSGMCCIVTPRFGIKIRCC